MSYTRLHLSSVRCSEWVRVVINLTHPLPRTVLTIETRKLPLLFAPGFVRHTSLPRGIGNFYLIVERSLELMPSGFTRPETIPKTVPEKYSCAALQLSAVASVA